MPTVEYALIDSAVLARLFSRTVERVEVPQGDRREVAVPVELAEHDRWVRHSAKKVPLTVHGQPAKSNDPMTWTSLDSVLRSKIGAGVGFVLNGDGIVCIDIDHCIVDGELSPWVEDILRLIPRTWIEVSPSGTGLHIWGTAPFSSGRVVQVSGGRLEVYGNGRYITITGKRWQDAPLYLGDLSALIGGLL